jgi:hypothetical protein
MCELRSKYSNVVYYSEIRWVRGGKTLQDMFALKEEVQSFMQSKGKPVLEFRDSAMDV